MKRRDFLSRLLAVPAAVTFGAGFVKATPIANAIPEYGGPPPGKHGYCGSGLDGRLIYCASCDGAEFRFARTWPSAPLLTPDSYADDLLLHEPAGTETRLVF